MRLSTLLLIILLLLIVGVANAQIKFTPCESTLTMDIGNGQTEKYSTGIAYQSTATKIDTIKSWLLVTMPIDECSGDCWITKRISGFEVIKIYGYKVEWHYLDKNKKPLSKNINVWMSKPVK